mmetsp:Transcript_23767/g.74811  ORF Transcript_23767/g.74811 Transcript_23767/m.74811 type:complete len:315 (+) Transcript_23767:768-1712(+)
MEVEQLRRHHPLVQLGFHPHVWRRHGEDPAALPAHARGEADAQDPAAADDRDGPPRRPQEHLLHSLAAVLGVLPLRVLRAVLLQGERPVPLRDAAVRAADALPRVHARGLDRRHVHRHVRLRRVRRRHLPTARGARRALHGALLLREPEAHEMDLHRVLGVLHRHLLARHALALHRYRDDEYVGEHGPDEGGCRGGRAREEAQEGEAGHFENDHDATKLRSQEDGHDGDGGDQEGLQGGARAHAAAEDARDGARRERHGQRRRRRLRRAPGQAAHDLVQEALHRGLRDRRERLVQLLHHRRHRARGHARGRRHL